MARPETVEGEILTSLELAGARGSLRTVLTPEDVLLELNNGNYLRISYNKIEAMRHHQFHIIPHWCSAIGALMIYSSIRILNGQLQIFAGLIGASIILSWLGFRKSALTIDSGDAGNYTLFGPVVDLIKFRVLTERIKDGIPFDKARDGLNEVIMTEYPSSSIFEELVDSFDDDVSTEDPLALAMSDLINKSELNETQTNPVNLEDNISVEPRLETIAEDNREPLLHGSISRARQVQSEMRTPPAHSGWSNIANRTEVIRSEQNNNRINYAQQNYFEEETKSSEDSFDLFGFNFEESPKTTNEEPFNMFGESFEDTQVISDNYEHNRSSFSMMPESSTPNNERIFPENREINNKPYFNSFQETGVSRPMNQLGLNFNSFEKTVPSPNSNGLEKLSEEPGIVSQAKESNFVQKELVPKPNPEGLKRISFGNKNKHLKRLRPNKKLGTRMTLTGMIKSSLGLKTPKLLRNRTLRSDKNLQNSSINKKSDLTMDALKVQAHQSHEAQIADALRQINTETLDSTEKYLEEISPDLVEKKLPTSFQDLRPSNDEKKDVLSTTGIARLD